MAHGVNRQQQQQQQRRVVSMAQKAEPIDAKRGLSMTEQYAKIMQNKGYFAPWSRENGWVDRVAIDNIRKANTPQVPHLPLLSCPLPSSLPEHSQH